MNKKIKNILRKLHGAAMSISPEATVKEINAFIKKDIDQAFQAIEDEVRRSMGDNLKSGLSGLDYCKGNNTRAKDFWKAWERGE